MVKDLNYYMSLNYQVEVVEDKEEGGYAFRCPELCGCMTCSDTLQEGFKLIEDAKKSWFSACLEDDLPIPEPSGIIMAFKNAQSSFDGEAKRLGLNDIDDVVVLVKEVRAERAVKLC